MYARLRCRAPPLLLAVLCGLLAVRTHEAAGGAAAQNPPAGAPEADPERLRNSLIAALHSNFPRLAVEEMQSQSTEQLLNIADAASAGIGRGGAEWQLDDESELDEGGAAEAEPAGARHAHGTRGRHGKKRKRLQELVQHSMRLHPTTFVLRIQRSGSSFLHRLMLHMFMHEHRYTPVTLARCSGSNAIKGIVPPPTGRGLPRRRCHPPAPRHEPQGPSPRPHLSCTSPPHTALARRCTSKPPGLNWHLPDACCNCIVPRRPRTPRARPVWAVLQPTATTTPPTHTHPHTTRRLPCMCACMCHHVHALIGRPRRTRGHGRAIPRAYHSPCARRPLMRKRVPLHGVFPPRACPLPPLAAPPCMQGPLP